MADSLFVLMWFEHVLAIVGLYTLMNIVVNNASVYGKRLLYLPIAAPIYYLSMYYFCELGRDRWAHGMESVCGYFIPGFGSPKRGSYSLF